MMLLCLCFLYFATDEASYVLVLQNNKTMEVQAPPTFDRDRCVVILPNGQKTSLPTHLVDQAKTEAYNERLAEERKAAAKAAAIAEAERQAEEAAPRPTKKINLGPLESLPVYSRSENTLSGMEPTEPTPAGPLAEPRISSFQSTNPVFISQEKIQRIQGGNLIECELKINEPTGATKVTVVLKVNYENAPAEEFTSLATPVDISYGQTGKVVFNLTTDDKILRTNYSVTAVLAVPQ